MIIFRTIKNELKMAVSQKYMLFILFLLPLFTSLLVGFEFSGGRILRLPMGVVDEDNSSISRAIVQQFRESEGFSINYENTSREELEELIKESRIKAGMIIPKDFAMDVKRGRKPKILMVYDGSHITAASMARKKASEILLTLSAGTSARMIAANTGLEYKDALALVQQLSFTSRTLGNPAGNFLYFYNPALITAIVQSGIALLAATAVRREEIPSRRLKRAGYLLGKLLFYGLCGTAVMLLNIAIQYIFFNLPVKGSYIDAVLLSAGVSFSAAMASLMLSALISDRLFCVSVTGIIFIPNTIMVGYSWPLASMPGIYRTLIPYLPFYHYASNIRELFLTGIPGTLVKAELGYFLLFILAAFVIAFAGIMRFRTEKFDGGASLARGAAV